MMNHCLQPIHIKNSIFKSQHCNNCIKINGNTGANTNWNYDYLKYTSKTKYKIHLLKTNNFQITDSK